MLQDYEMMNTSSFDHGDQDHSQHSFVFALNRLLRNISTMNQTVLVPSKLHELEDDDQDCKSLCSDSDGHSSTRSNMYEEYQMLNEAKNGLLWAADSDDQTHDLGESSPASQLKYHYQRVQQLLNQLTHVADNITNKYQLETGSM